MLSNMTTSASNERYPPHKLAEGRQEGFRGLPAGGADRNGAGPHHLGGRQDAGYRQAADGPRLGSDGIGAQASRGRLPSGLSAPDWPRHLGDPCVSEEVEVGDQNTEAGDRSDPGSFEAIEG